jgi:hypothetical protein
MIEGTIAKSLDIKDFPFEIKDKSGNMIYTEQKSGFWEFRKYDSEGRNIYYESCTGNTYSIEYDQKDIVFFSRNNEVLINKKNDKE